MGVRDYTIYDIICRNALLYGNQDAVICKDTRLTHKEFKSKCDQLAAGMLRDGLKPGDRVAVLANNCADYLIIYGACARIGVILLAINWRFQPEEIEYVLTDCSPKILFIGRDYDETISNISSDLNFIERKVLIDSNDSMDGYTSIDELYVETDIQSDEVDAESGFVIMHTAAVDGRPKGALLSQSNCVASSVIAVHEYGLTPSDCHICMLPLYHVAGLNTSIATMLAGGRNVIIEKFDPVVTLKAIEEEKGTVFVNFAPIMSMLMDEFDQNSYDISSVRHVYGLDHPDTIARFTKNAPEAVYHTIFAQTEAMGISNAPIDEKPGSSGKPCFLSKVRLFDEYDNEVPVGTPGEICVRSPTVFMGYWGLDDETVYTFRNGWHHTGDIGRFDEDGYLYYVKRKAQKELIKPGGENVYPIEVEKAILEHDAVVEVCVIGVPDPKWGEAVKAVCVLEDGAKLTESELIEFVGSKIARYKKPSQVAFVQSFPKDAEGEIDRDQVKKDQGAKY